MTNRILANPLSRLLLAAMLCSPAGAALADDVEGAITSIDNQTRSVTVNGQAFYVDDKTDYDDDYNRFEDLKVGDRVEIDYRDDNGRKLITEIEKDD